MHCCYEPVPFGYVLYRRLEAMGARNLVVRPPDWSTYDERAKIDTGERGVLVFVPRRYLAGVRG